MRELRRTYEVLASNGRAVPVVVVNSDVSAISGPPGPTTRGRGTLGERDGRIRLRGALKRKEGYDPAASASRASVHPGAGFSHGATDQVFHLGGTDEGLEELPHGFRRFLLSE